MARTNLDVIATVAGMFVLLPGLLSTWFLPDRPRPPAPVTLADLVNANATYMTAHWPVLLGSALVVAFGSLTLLALLVHPGRPTVADAMRIGAAMLPFYILTNLLQTIVVSLGLFLLVLPGLYLFARFLCIAPVVAAEGRRSPVAIAARSLQLTRGNGWRIILLLLVILLVTVVVSTVFSLLFGILATLLLPPDLARFLAIFLNSLIETGIAVAVTLVSASLYRQATAPDRSPFG